MLYAAAIVYACATGWCVNVLGSVEAASSDECARRIVMVMTMTGGFPACFVPANSKEAYLLPRLDEPRSTAGSMGTGNWTMRNHQ
jgi:hypothetical protein